MCMPESLISAPLRREVVHGHDQQNGSTVSCLGRPRCAEAAPPFTPALSWPRAGPGSIQHFWLAVLAVAFVSRPVSMATRGRGTNWWNWAPFPLCLFPAVGQGFWRKHHLCVQRAEGSRKPLCQVNSCSSWWQNLARVNFSVITQVGDHGASWEEIDKNPFVFFQ